MCAAIAAIGLAACGSRSALYGPETRGEGGGGEGGTTTSTTGMGGTTTSSSTTSSSTTSSQGGGGEGGGGGPPGPCGELEYITPFVSLAGGMQPHQRTPKLAFSSDDDTRVTVGSAWQFVDTPNAPLELRRTSLSPWPDFPAGSSLGNTNKMDLDGGVSFAIAQSPGDRFALLFADFQESPAGGLRFSADFKPAAANPPDTFLVDPDAQKALFLSRGKSRFLYGGGFQSGSTHEIRAGLIDEDLVESLFFLGCASAAPLADAVPYLEYFFVAMANGTDAFGCDVGVPGPPSRLQIVKIQESGVVENVVEIGSQSMTDLKLAPRSDGAWLVWTDPGGEDLPPSILIGQLTTDGELAGTLEWSVPFQPGSLAITSFEDFLALAWIQSDPEGASPRVQVFGPDFTPLGAIEVQSAGVAKAPLSFLGSPFARQALLAWSETVGDPDLGDQIRMTRVDCLDN